MLAARLTTLTIAFLLASTGVHAQELVTECRQEVTSGVLAGDLDCPGDSAAVFVAHRGSLDLAGFTLSGGTVSVIVCEGDCTIEGSGGLVTGGSRNGIQAQEVQRSSTATVSNLQISGNGLYGITAEAAVVSNCEILDNTSVGIYAREKNVEVTGSTISGNGTGVYAMYGRVSALGSTIAGNGAGVVSRKRVDLVDTTISDSGVQGVRARKVVATNTDILNSGTTCSETDECYDIGSRGRPRLDGVTCGTSAKLDKASIFRLPEDWDVCTFD
jgi:hypothetical protein